MRYIPRIVMVISCSKLLIMDGFVLNNQAIKRAGTTEIHQLLV